MKLDTETLEPIWVKVLTVSNSISSRSISGLATNPDGDLFICGSLADTSKYYLKKHRSAQHAV